MEINLPDAGGTTPRRMLARRLRRCRARTELSIRGLADKIGYPYGYLSRVENEKQLPSDALAEALDAFFETDDLFAELLEMCRANLIADYSRALVARENETIRLQVFTSSLIPGLLQTEGYARELFREGGGGIDEEQVEERVLARMRRKRLLAREDPPFYWAIFDEAALKRAVGGPDCMRRQLQEVLDSAARPHIAVQVLPFERGAYSMMGGCLSMLTMEDGSTVGHIESFVTGDVVESPKQLVPLAERFDRACASACPEGESLDLVRAYLREYEDASIN